MNCPCLLSLPSAPLCLSPPPPPPPPPPSPPQEYASNKARDLGLGSLGSPGTSSQSVDGAVLEGRAYRHLDAMRYRLNLLQTLVCVTSHAVTPSQAEGLWLALVERALSDAELDLSFEALLGLGREAPHGLTTLAGTFFERMCSQDGDPAWGAGSGPWVEGVCVCVRVCVLSASPRALQALEPPPVVALLDLPRRGG